MADTKTILSLVLRVRPFRNSLQGGRRLFAIDDVYPDRPDRDD